MTESDVPPRAWDDHRKMQWIRENEGLIYCQPLRRIGQYELEDMKQLALETTLQAFMKFDPSMGVQLSTYVYSSIRNALNMQVRSDRAKKRSAVLLSLHQNSSNGRDYAGYENLDLRDQDTLHDPEPEPEQTVENRDAVRTLNHLIRQKMTPMEMEILDLLQQGISQARIAKILNCSQAKISSSVKLCRLKLIYEARKAGLCP